MKRSSHNTLVASSWKTTSLLKCVFDQKSYTFNQKQSRVCG